MTLSQPPPRPFPGPGAGGKPGRSKRRQGQIRRRRLVLLAVVVALCVLGVKLASPSIKRAVAALQGGPSALDPSVFATGACQAYPPTSGDRHMTVFLDAGHGGLDPGALGMTESGQSVTEASLT